MRTPCTQPSAISCEPTTPETVGFAQRSSYRRRASAWIATRRSESGATRSPGLFLRDAARGLVAYRYDLHVYVLWLRDGETIDTGFWWLAQFVDGGLVVGAGNRLWLIPFAELE